MSDDLMEQLGQQRMVFWRCLNRDHLDVTWMDGVATCDTCRLTSEMTGRFMALVREHERSRVVEHIAQQIEAVDPVEWALAGQRAGQDAARIVRDAFKEEPNAH